jgi:hypothetical protein
VDKNSKEPNGVIVLGVPIDFMLNDYRVQVGPNGVKEYLVPAALLNRCQRAVWPEADLPTVWPARASGGVAE